MEWHSLGPNHNAIPEKWGQRMTFTVYTSPERHTDTQTHTHSLSLSPYIYLSLSLSPRTANAGRSGRGQSSEGGASPQWAGPVLRGRGQSSQVHDFLLFPVFAGRSAQAEGGRGGGEGGGGEVGLPIQTQAHAVRPLGTQLLQRRAEVWTQENHNHKMNTRNDGRRNDHTNICMIWIPRIVPNINIHSSAGYRYYNLGLRHDLMALFTVYGNVFRINGSMFVMVPSELRRRYKVELRDGKQSTTFAELSRD